MKNILKKVAGLAFILILATGCSSKVAGEDKGPGTAKDGNELKIETASLNLIEAVKEGGYNLVSTEELKTWVDEGKDMIVVDTMPAKSYEKNRIPGAVNAELPLKLEEVSDEQKEAFIKALGEDKDKTIVFYCGFVGCPRSHVAGMLAKEAGYTNTYRQPGGIIAWLDAGYDVEGTSSK